MGLISYIIKRWGGERRGIEQIHESLESSFSNVKKDMGNIHKHLTIHQDHTHKKFQNIEERMKKIEVLLQNQLQKTVKIQRETQEGAENIEETDEIDENLVNIISSLPRAELKLFKTLYELQTSLNTKHVSYKSLAKYLYPEKEYNSIRSTITQFILRLNTEGLIEKRRIGKETYVKLTPVGHKILKNIKTKRKLKEIEANCD